MSDEEFAAELGEALSPNREDIIRDVLALVKRKLEGATPPTATEIEREIDRSGIVHRTMLAWADRWVANEVGNRLRCGIWDGRAVDRVFDSIWTEQFDTAIQDRIREKARQGVDAAVKERLAKL